MLILREVLGFSAKEVAEALDTTTASVNSALQRARATVDERLPARSQQATLRALGDQQVRELVERYMDAMQRGDVDAVVAMLAEDAAWSMPPLATWFSGREEIARFLAWGPLSGQFRWRRLAAHANGQVAVAAYTWHDGRERVPAVRARRAHARRRAHPGGHRVHHAPSPESDDREKFARWPDQALDPGKVVSVFERFGLPGPPGSPPGGRWRGKSVAASNAAAARSTSSSAPGRPAICSPIGRPAGGEAAGDRHRRLAGEVEVVGHQPPRNGLTELARHDGRGPGGPRRDGKGAHRRASA